MKKLLIGFGVLISAFVFVFVLNGVGWINYKIFAPKIEQVRYDTFKHSQSYTDGQIHDLENMQMQYETATPDQKTALRSVILQRFSSFNEQNLPAAQQQFYNSLLTTGN